MSVKTYLLNPVVQGVSMPGMGGQYAPEYPKMIIHSGLIKGLSTYQYDEE
jgi:hypothetical protein